MQTTQACGSELPPVSSKPLQFSRWKDRIAKAWSRYLRSKHRPFVIFMLLAPFAVIATFNDEAFMWVYSVVTAGPWEVAVALLLGCALVWVDYQVLAWVLRTKFLCGCYRKPCGILLYWLGSVLCITWCMQFAAGVSIDTLTFGWQWPDWGVLLTAILMALFFVIFYDFLVKWASPAFSKLDYTVFHSALDQMMVIIDDFEAKKLHIEKPEVRESAC